MYGEEVLVAQLCLFVTPWTVAHQPPLSMQFSRKEYCNGLPFPSPGDLLYPGIKPGSPALQVDSLPLSHQGSPSNSMEWNQKGLLLSDTSQYAHVSGSLQRQLLRSIRL